MTFTTITTKGQVVIPIKLRQKIGLLPGKKLRVSANKSSIILHLDDYQEALTKFQKKVSKHISKKGITPITDLELIGMRKGTWSNKI